MPTPIQPNASHLRADAHYSGPPGSHVGAGRILLDGSLDRTNRGLTGSASVSPGAMLRNSVQGKSMNTIDVVGGAPASPMLNYASPLPSGNPYHINKRYGLKADANGANGGIGVSYSNVVLGNNSINVSPMLGDRKSSYTYEYGAGSAMATIKG